jgi:hypothetical protein
MGKPQQPELGRSGHTPVTEGQHAREVIQGQEGPGDEGSVGPVPRTTAQAITQRPSRISRTWRPSGTVWPATATTTNGTQAGGRERPACRCCRSTASGTTPRLPAGRRASGRVKIKEVHSVPMDRRNLLDWVKLPAAQETPTWRSSSGG